MNLMLLFSSLSFAGIQISTKVNSDQIAQLKNIELGKKVTIYEKEGMKFSAVVKHLKEKIPELNGLSTPYLIYGEIIENGKIINYPQLISLKDRELTYETEDKNGKKTVLKFKISE